MPPAQRKLSRHGVVESQLAPLGPRGMQTYTSVTFWVQ